MILVIIFVIIIVIFIIIKFGTALNKDNDDLQGGSASDKFRTIVSVLNDQVFSGNGTITTTDKRSFNLYDGYNQIIQFHYSTGHLTIIWKYKYYEKEIIHERTFNDVRNLSIFEQQKIANSLYNEMNVIKENHMNNVLSPVVEDVQSIIKAVSNEMADSDILFLIAKGGIVELKNRYKDLSDKGKFEVIVFNSLLVLNTYNDKYPSKTESTYQAYFVLLQNQAITYGVDLSGDALKDFIDSRWMFYSNELIEIKKGQGHTPGSIYTVFYINPLVLKPEPSFDLIESMLFFIAFTPMINWVVENTKKKI
jgi:hypothetical protein